jgi:hypothetical protein
MGWKEREGERYRVFIIVGYNLGEWGIGRGRNGRRGTDNGVVAHEEGLDGTKNQEADHARLSVVALGVRGEGSGTGWRT